MMTKEQLIEELKKAERNYKYALRESQRFAIDGFMFQVATLMSLAEKYYNMDITEIEEIRKSVVL